jgi:hypothetical protein
MKQRAAMQQEHGRTALSQQDHVGASDPDPTRLVSIKVRFKDK